MNNHHNWTIEISDSTLEHCGFSHIGNVRKENQDYQIALKIRDNKFIFAVCDGMGGHAAGSTASKIAGENILSYSKENFDEEPKDFLEKAIVNANSTIFKEAEENKKLKGMGTTVAVLVIDQNLGYVAHVGDSRVYWIRNDKMKRLTKDHSYVQYLVDNEVITEEDAFKHPKGNILTKSVGISLEFKPEIRNRPILLEVNDILLLSSDGLHNSLTDEQILNHIQDNKIPISELCEKLVKDALENGANDNITVQLIKCNSLSKKKLFHKKPTLFYEFQLSKK